MTISIPRLPAFLLACAGAVCGTVGCVSNSDDAKGGTGGSTSGTGGSTSSMGGSTSSSGGSTGTTGGTSSSTGGTASTEGAFACPTPTEAVITDFTLPADAKSTTDASFGDFTTTFSGGTFAYPPATATYPLTSDVSKNNWHVTGNVGDYSGMGLYFSGTNPADGKAGSCSKFDASAFKGIQFSISGSTPSGTTQENTVTLQIGTAADDVASSWLNAHKANATDADKAPNFGRCMPASNQYDGTCGAPGKTISISATPTVVKVMWADLTGGKPAPTVNPSEITFITWIMPNPTGVGTTTPTPYMADVTIDDLQFIP